MEIIGWRLLRKLKVEVLFELVSYDMFRYIDESMVIYYIVICIGCFIVFLFIVVML